MGREPWSDQSVGFVSPLSDFCKHLNQRAMAVGSYPFLSLGNENPETQCNYHLYEYTNYVALIFHDEWVFPLVYLQVLLSGKRTLSYKIITYYWETIFSIIIPILVKNLKNKTVLIKMAMEKQAEILLKLKKFHNINTYLHKKLNTCLITEKKIN